MKQLLRRRNELQKLATTPLLAAMICTLYQERGDKIPQERLKLYQECVEMLLERREEKKEVDLDEDYIDLSFSQKIVLLRHLAYWMLDNEYSVVPIQEAEEQFADRIPALDLPQEVSAAKVCRLFVERIGLLQEAIVDEISFRHRTFQEYLAADAAIYHNRIGVLIKHARNDQWRETIILATGLAPEKEKGRLFGNEWSQFEPQSYARNILEKREIVRLSKPASIYNLPRFLPQVTSLSLADSQLSDLSPLQGLTNLTTLNLSDSQVSDLSPIQGLTNLTTLNLSGSLVSDLSPIQYLSKLNQLTLDQSQISRYFSSLAAMERQTGLTVYGVKNYIPRLHRFLPKTS